MVLTYKDGIKKCIKKYLTLTPCWRIMIKKILLANIFLNTKVMKDKNKTILMCSECLSRNYSTHKNKKDSSERLELMKFCPRCNKHTLHKETK